MKKSKPKMQQNNFLIKEVKIYNSEGELVAQGDSFIPLEEKECEVCKAELLILSMEGTPNQYMETGRHEHSIQ